MEINVRRSHSSPAPKAHSPAAQSAPSSGPNASDRSSADVRSPARRETREQRARGRAKLDLDARARGQRTRRNARGTAKDAKETKPREARAQGEGRSAGDDRLDDLYLRAMAASSILTSEQEVAIGRRIADAERRILEGVVEAPTGAQAVSTLGLELELERVDVRDVLLNPDQADLDLTKARETVANAFALAVVEDPSSAARVSAELGDVRIDTAFVARLVAGLREAGAADPRDALALLSIERAQRDLKREKERLVVGNLRLVVLFARKYLGRGIALLDLVQEGNLGLMRAADKFDHRRGFRFSTYAAWWIKQALQRALLDRTVRLPVHVADDRRRVTKVQAAFVAQHRREATPEELSVRCSLPLERIENILSLPHQPSSLDIPVGEDGEARLIDLIPSNTPRPDDSVAHHALSGDLVGLFEVLSPREQQVVRMRFGLGEMREHTLEEVGRELALTRERIRQIERSALAKLKARSDRVELKSYLDH